MNALVIRKTEELDTYAYEPRSAGEAMTMAANLVASRLLSSVSTPEAAFAVMVTGRELGLTAMQSLRSIHIIKGRPCMSSDLILALVKRSALCRRFQLLKTSSEIASYATQREGEDMTEMSFTIAQAQRAGLLGNDNWKRFPEAMLRARCIAALSRAVYPDVVLGIYETNELEVGEVPQPEESQVRAVEMHAEAVSSPTQEAPKQDDEEVVSAIRSGFAGAASLDALNRCTAGVTRAFQAGRFSAETKAVLLTEFKERKYVLSSKRIEEAAE